MADRRLRPSVATGSAKPASASEKFGTAPVNTNATISTSPVTPAGSASVHHRPMASKATAITRLPASGSPAGAGMAISAQQIATSIKIVSGARLSGVGSDVVGGVFADMG